jgi:predicted  nucleic acid-binding Zn-ribbon protein
VHVVASLDDLLVVQELDTSLDQLRHRRAHLPQFDERAELARSRAQLDVVRDEIAQRLHTLRSEQKECEDHASLLEDKGKEIATALYDGSVVSHKELESLQAEQASVGERQRGFEDRALELMEEAEPLEEELARADADIAALQVQVDRVEQEIVVATAELDVQIEDVEGQRAAAAATVAPQLLEAYEPLRVGLGGVAIARLVGARCEGCHLEIPSAELEAIRHAPADEPVSCPECMRLLVR